MILLLLRQRVVSYLEAGIQVEAVYHVYSIPVSTCQSETIENDNPIVDLVLSWLGPRGDSWGQPPVELKLHGIKKRSLLTSKKHYELVIPV